MRYWLLMIGGLGFAAIAAACGELVPRELEVDAGARGGLDAEVDATGIECGGRPPVTVYIDGDGDGYGDPETAMHVCEPGPGVVERGEDCDDTRANVYPGAPERDAGVCDGVDRDCDGRWEIDHPGACASIQGAIDRVVIPSTIWVAPGRYLERLDWSGRPARVVSTDGPEVTVLDGQLAGRCATFDDGEGPEAGLEGFTITGGRDLDRGGGVLIDGASPTLRALIVTGNQAPGGYGAGGGIYVVSSASLIENVVIHANSSGYVGGGLAISGSSTLIVRNVIVASNVAGSYGGGIDLYGFAGTIENAIVVGNSAAGGGAFSLNGGGPLLSNVTIHANHANTGAAFHLISSSPIVTGATSSGNTIVPGALGATTLAATSSTPTFRFCNFHDQAPAFDGAPNPVGLGGNISAPPEFVSTSDPDPLAWDLRLRAGSPLVDAGDPGLFDPDGTRSDIGAHGGPGAAEW